MKNEHIFYFLSAAKQQPEQTLILHSCSNEFFQGRMYKWKSGLLDFSEPFSTPTQVGNGSCSFYRNYPIKCRTSMCLAEST